MKELELKDMMARHRQELSEKDITISSVSPRSVCVQTTGVTDITIMFCFFCAAGGGQQDPDQRRGQLGQRERRTEQQTEGST